MPLLDWVVEMYWYLELSRICSSILGRVSNDHRHCITGRPSVPASTHVGRADRRQRDPPAFPGCSIFWMSETARSGRTIRRRSLMAAAMFTRGIWAGDYWGALAGKYLPRRAVPAISAKFGCFATMIFVLNFGFKQSFYPE